MTPDHLIALRAQIAALQTLAEKCLAIDRDIHSSPVDLADALDEFAEAALPSASLAAILTLAAGMLDIAADDYMHIENCVCGYCECRRKLLALIDATGAGET